MDSSNAVTESGGVNDPLATTARIIDRILRWLTPVALLGIAASLLRTLNHGGLWSFCVQTALIVVVQVTAWFGGRWAPRWRMAIYCGSLVAYSLVAMMQWALLGPGLTVYILALMVASLFGLRRWLIVLALVMVCMLAAAVGYVTGWLPINFEPIVMLRSPEVWFVTILTLFVAGWAPLLWEGMYHELSQSNRLLADSENRFRTILDGVNDAFFLHDSETGEILAVNRATCDLFGYSSEEFRRLTVGDLSSGVTPYTQTGAMALIEQALSGENPMFEWHAKHRSGRLFWVEVSARGAVLDGKNRVFVVARDITERKEAEKQIAQIRERLERASTAAQVALWEWDVDSGVIVWSDVVDSMLGYERNGFPRRIEAWEEAVHPDDRERVLDLLSAHIKGDGSYDAEYRIRRADGTYVWWHGVGIARRNTVDKGVSMSGACIDVTRRREAEDALRHREEQLRKQNDVLVSLMLQGILTEASLKDALVKITEASAGLIKTERVSVWLYNEDYAHIRCLDLYEQSLGRHSEGEELASSEFSSYTSSHRRGAVVAATDVYSDPRTRDIPVNISSEREFVRFWTRPYGCTGGWGG